MIAKQEKVKAPYTWSVLMCYWLARQWRDFWELLTPRLSIIAWCWRRGRRRAEQEAWILDLPHLPHLPPPGLTGRLCRKSFGTLKLFRTLTAIINTNQRKTYVVQTCIHPWPTGLLCLPCNDWLVRNGCISDQPIGQSNILHRSLLQILWNHVSRLP